MIRYKHGSGTVWYGCEAIQIIFPSFEFEITSLGETKTPRCSRIGKYMAHRFTTVKADHRGLLDIFSVLSGRYPKA